MLFRTVRFIGELYCKSIIHYHNIHSIFYQLLCDNEPQHFIIEASINLMNKVAM